MSLASTLKFIVQHPMNRQEPFSAVARFVRWQIVSRLRSEVEFEWINGSKLIAKRSMTGATGNIYCGLHEYVDMSFLLHLLRPEDLFVDVGANVGSYTVLASAVCGARSISIEPDPKTAKYLAQNISVNELDRRCSIAVTAVGNDEGTISFTVGKDTVNQVSKNHQEPSQMVALTRLDTVLGEQLPTLVKMDVEGFEMEALSGAKTMLSRPELMGIVIENTDPNVVSILHSYGFFRHWYHPIQRQLSTCELEVGSSNGIFVRDISSANARLRNSERRTYRGQVV